MSAQLPNHIKLQLGEVVNGFPFGEVRSVTPIHFAGTGHKPHLEARFDGGVRIDLTPEAVVAFIQHAQRALAKLPGGFADCSGALANTGGDDGDD